MNYYISDTHFGHRNVLEFDHRPFTDINEMNHVLIELWNGRVQAEDHVYILGDVVYRSERSIDWYLKQLNGHKHLIVGNHDWRLLQNEKALSYLESVDELLTIMDGDRKVVLCHYPMLEWNDSRHGSWHIHGHIHNRKDEIYEILKKNDHVLNAGCMINHYMPVTFEELIKNNQEFWGNDDGTVQLTD